MFKATIINLFVAPLTLKVARALAKSHDAKDFYHQGIAVYCTEPQIPLVKESIDEVVRFFGAEWPQYRRNLKCIIVDEQISSALWFSRRTLLVRESDANRMGSARHMASWLVADFQRVQTLRKKSALHIIWSSSVMNAANEAGKRKRDEFLKQRK